LINPQRRKMLGVFSCPLHLSLTRSHPMKTLIRLFFRTLRIVLGPFMLLKERLSRPAALQRSAERQAEVDRQCTELALYQFKTCPFCIKVRQEIHALALPIQLLDAQHEGDNRSALKQGTGAYKVPCLRISDAQGRVQWLSESGAIVAYLRGRFVS